MRCSDIVAAEAAVIVDPARQRPMAVAEIHANVTHLLAFVN
jgi:hypothetical protein